LRCRNERDPVAQMHRRATEKAATSQAFMQQLAERMSDLTGHRLRIDTHARFAADLVAHKVISRIVD
jgi:hypothetical protein